MTDAKRVAVVKGLRTPFTKAGTHFKNITAVDQGVHIINGLLKQSNLPVGLIEQLAFGVVLQDPSMPNIARGIVFRSDLPTTVHAHSVSNNCITGIEAVTSIGQSILSGQIEMGIAGGAESMSNPPIMFHNDFARILADFAMSKSVAGRISSALRIRPWHFLPKTPAVAEPSTGLTMGEHCEIMAKQWKISRQVQDEIAFRSHVNANKATDDGRLKPEILPLADLAKDTLIRADSSLEKLSKLKPVFDKSPAGTITAGNSSALTDGASAVVLMSEKRAKEEGVEVLAYIKAFEYAAISPDEGLLMAPGIAVPRLLRKTGLMLQDLGVIEAHEAFGAQVACNLKAWESGWHGASPLGKVDLEKLNPCGGSIAVGHPFSATGCRIMITLANEMQRRDAQYGLLSICAAGGMAAAMLLER